MNTTFQPDTITNEDLARMIAGGFNEMHEKFDAIDKRFEDVDKRFDNIEATMATKSDIQRIEARLDNHEDRIVVLENK